MDEESKQLLRENNGMLKKLLGYQRLARWFGFIKWVIVIGSALGALYYLEPMINDLWDTYSNLLNTVSSTSINTLPGQ